MPSLVATCSKLVLKVSNYNDLQLIWTLHRFCIYKTTVCLSNTVTQSITISEPIREKYVQIFSLRQNMSEMSVKTILEKPMRKDFFTPPRQEGDRRGGAGRKVKRKIERKGKEKLL